jgi:hypothetical protein
MRIRENALCMLILLLGTAVSAQTAGTRCEDKSWFCADPAPEYQYEGHYIGHDEPSLLFYSTTPGSGNSYKVLLRLPKDPPRLPLQDGTGGTFNFQLHPAFWFGMAMCDTQSYPEFTTTCTPDSDTNIFTSTTPSDAHYIGKHPGTAFMEMQFYPPGWAAWPLGSSCDGTHYCAALNIDSLSVNPNTGQANNDACLDGLAGIEPVNFAFVTRSGVADSPGDPLNFNHFVPNLATDLLMNPGDVLLVDLHDSAAGFQVVITDLTTGQTGSMTASIANGFAQVVFAPSATSCTSTPYAFHPMYSTSSEDTSVPWAAHTYNVAFSDEIGHFEYCDQTDGTPGGSCTLKGVNDPGGLDSDDTFCFNASQSTRIPISGCLGTDLDFDGVPYQFTWPGTLSNPGKDQQFNPRAILFTSPLANGNTNYDRVAFETDLPAIEGSPQFACFFTGIGCTNPPPGAQFYPIFTTRGGQGSCTWQLGGPNIPGTKQTFGGNSTAEYGNLLSIPIVTPSGVEVGFADYRQILTNNPCPSNAAMDRSDN